MFCTTPVKKVQRAFIMKRAGLRNPVCRSWAGAQFTVNQIETRPTSCMVTLPVVLLSEALLHIPPRKRPGALWKFSELRRFRWRYLLVARNVPRDQQVAALAFLKWFVIRSAARFTYTEVAAILANTRGPEAARRKALVPHLLTCTTSTARCSRRAASAARSTSRPPRRRSSATRTAGSRRSCRAPATRRTG